MDEFDRRDFHVPASRETRSSTTTETCSGATSAPWSESTGVSCQGVMCQYVLLDVCFDFVLILWPIFVLFNTLLFLTLRLCPFFGILCRPWPTSWTCDCWFCFLSSVRRVSLPSYFLVAVSSVWSYRVVLLLLVLQLDISQDWSYQQTTTLSPQDSAYTLSASLWFVVSFFLLFLLFSLLSVSLLFTLFFVFFACTYDART